MEDIEPPSWRNARQQRPRCAPRLCLGNWIRIGWGGPAAEDVGDGPPPAKEKPPPRRPDAGASAVWRTGRAPGASGDRLPATLGCLVGLLGETLLTGKAARRHYLLDGPPFAPIDCAGFAPDAAPQKAGFAFSRLLQRFDTQERARIRAAQITSRAFDQPAASVD